MCFDRSPASMAISLVLFVAVVVMWMRSFRVGDGIVWSTSWTTPPSVQKTYAASSADGAVGFYIEHATYPALSKDQSLEGLWAAHVDYRKGMAGWRYEKPGPSDQSGRWLGFSLFRSDGTIYPASAHQPRQGPAVAMATRMVTIPYWFLAIFLASLPVIFVIRRWPAARRGAAGRCPGCGYDLRASPDCCPECGMAVAAGHGASG